MSYEVVFNDLIGQDANKRALIEIHKLFLNPFVQLNQIEKVIVITSTRVDVVVNDHVKCFEYIEWGKRMECIRSKGKENYVPGE